MSTRKQYQSMTEEQRKADCAKVIRQFYRIHHRPPGVFDMYYAFVARARKLWGSWEKAVKAALGIPTGRHEWSDEEILEILRDLHRKLGRFPKAREIESANKSLKRLIILRFGGISAALEQAIHDSPRLQILKALQELTPPTCDAASTREIAALLKQKKVSLSIQEVGLHLDDARQNGYVNFKWYSSTSAYWLSSLGKGFLQQWTTTGSK